MPCPLFSPCCSGRVLFTVSDRHSWMPAKTRILNVRRIYIDLFFPFTPLNWTYRNNAYSHIILHNYIDIKHIINPLNAELSPIRHLLALVGAHHIVHVSRIRVNGSRKLLITRLERNVSSFNELTRFWKQMSAKICIPLIQYELEVGVLGIL